MSYLWYFTGGDDGAHPSTGVTFRPRKLLLGTDTTGDGRIYPLKPGAAGSTTAVASAGGAYGAGTIYQLTP